MNLNGLNIKVILVSFVVVLAAAFGVKALVYMQNVTRPVEEYLSSSKVVESYEITRDDAGHRKLDLRLAWTPDFKDEYENIEAKVAPATRAGNLRLEIMDKRDAVLEKAYYEMHFSLYEAAATGAFTSAAKRVDEVAAARGLDDAVMEVTQERIFVALRHGDRYLYEIIPRQGMPGEQVLLFQGGSMDRSQYIHGVEGGDAA